ncbi:hypothetical protein HK102_002654 [Quaeritorhiza haematococci]|nr:hypothetical protein HK102_002654 [Quaeritorhiza haematococci]
MAEVMNQTHPSGYGPDDDFFNDVNELENTRNAEQHNDEQPMATATFIVDDKYDFFGTEASEPVRQEEPTHQEEDYFQNYDSNDNNNNAESAAYQTESFEEPSIQQEQPEQQEQQAQQEQPTKAASQQDLQAELKAEESAQAPADGASEDRQRAPQSEDAAKFEEDNYGEEEFAAEDQIAPAESQNDESGQIEEGETEQQQNSQDGKKDRFGHRHYITFQPVANKLLAMKWDEANRKMHLNKVAKAKPTIDNGSPKVYVHLQLKLKKLQMEQERLNHIDRSNKRLLEKMAHIMRIDSRDMSAASASQRTDFAHSLNGVRKSREQQTIYQENQAILQRLEAKEPHYDHFHWLEDRRHQLKWLENIAGYPQRYSELRKQLDDVLEIEYQKHGYGPNNRFHRQYHSRRSFLQPRHQGQDKEEGQEEQEQYDNNAANTRRDPVPPAKPAPTVANPRSKATTATTRPVRANVQAEAKQPNGTTTTTVKIKAQKNAVRNNNNNRITVASVTVRTNKSVQKQAVPADKRAPAKRASLDKGLPPLPAIRSSSADKLNGNGGPIKREDSPLAPTPTPGFYADESEPQQNDAPKDEPKEVASENNVPQAQEAVRSPSPLQKTVQSDVNDAQERLAETTMPQPDDRLEEANHTEPAEAPADNQAPAQEQAAHDDFFFDDAAPQSQSNAVVEPKLTDDFAPGIVEQNDNTEDQALTSPDGDNVNTDKAFENVAIDENPDKQADEEANVNNVTSTVETAEIVQETEAVAEAVEQGTLEPAQVQSADAPQQVESIEAPQQTEAANEEPTERARKSVGSIHSRVGSRRMSQVTMEQQRADDPIYVEVSSNETTAQKSMSRRSSKASIAADAAAGRASQDQLTSNADGNSGAAEPTSTSRRMSLANETQDQAAAEITHESSERVPSKPPSRNSRRSSVAVRASQAQLKSKSQSHRSSLARLADAAPEQANVEQQQPAASSRPISRKGSAASVSSRKSVAASRRMSSSAAPKNESDSAPQPEQTENSRRNSKPSLSTRSSRKSLSIVGNETSVTQEAQQVEVTDNAQEAVAPENSNDQGEIAEQGVENQEGNVAAVPSKPTSQHSLVNVDTTQAAQEEAAAPEASSEPPKEEIAVVLSEEPQSSEPQSSSTDAPAPDASENGIVAIPAEEHQPSDVDPKPQDELQTEAVPESNSSAPAEDQPEQLEAPVPTEGNQPSSADEAAPSEEQYKDETFEEIDGA